MSPDSDIPDPFAGEFWDDLRFLIARGTENRRPDLGNTQAGRAYRMVALNVNSGKAAHALIRMDVIGSGTGIDVATSIADLITSAFVALADYVPDPREFMEIQVKDYRVHAEENRHPFG